MDNDINDLFKKKNKEILITNLKYDLDKNIGSLFETVNNIFNLEFDVAYQKILSILKDGNFIDHDSEINKLLNQIKIENYENLDRLIQEKKYILLEKIENIEFNEQEMNKYYDLVFSTTKDMKERIANKFNDSIENIDRELNTYIVNNINTNTDLTVSRMNDYLKNRFYEKLVTKLHVEIMLRDNNLINKVKEVYLRYQDICSKTSNA